MQTTSAQYIRNPQRHKEAHLNLRPIAVDAITRVFHQSVPRKHHTWDDAGRLRNPDKAELRKYDRDVGDPLAELRNYRDS